MAVEPLSCTATSAVLGSAGPTEVWNFTSGVAFPNSWYHFALANKLAGVDLDLTMGLNNSQRSGADVLGRALLFTPNPFQSGSSVSHWDTIAFPNLLMEPNINGDLTHSVGPPRDLTLPLLQDIGWN